MTETIKKYIKPFSAREKAFFICKTPILKAKPSGCRAKRIEIGKLNNPAIGGTQRRVMRLKLQKLSPADAGRSVSKLVS